MKKIMFILLSLCWFVPASQAQKDRQKVWDLVVTLDHALVKKDSMQLKSVLTDDFIGAVPTGQSFNRPAYLNYHCRPNVGLISIRDEGPEKASIRFYGNTAIVNRRVEVVRKAPDGSSKELTVQRIEVCVLENGIWHVASGQGTEVALH